MLHAGISLRSQDKRMLIVSLLAWGKERNAPRLHIHHPCTSMYLSGED